VQKQAKSEPPSNPRHRCNPCRWGRGVTRHTCSCDSNGPPPTHSRHPVCATNRTLSRHTSCTALHCAHTWPRSLTQLLQMDPTCRRPVGRAVLDAVGRGEGGDPGGASSSQSDSTRSSGGVGGGVRSNGTHNPPPPSSHSSSSSGGSKKRSSREVLEQAMTAAESGEFARALALTEEARTLGASPRNLDKTIGYVVMSLSLLTCFVPS